MRSVASRRAGPVVLVRPFETRPAAALRVRVLLMATWRDDLTLRSHAERGVSKGRTSRGGVHPSRHGLRPPSPFETRPAAALRGRALFIATRRDYLTLSRHPERRLSKGRA